MILLAKNCVFLTRSCNLFETCLLEFEEKLRMFIRSFWFFVQMCFCMYRLPLDFWIFRNYARLISWALRQFVSNSYEKISVPFPFVDLRKLFSSLMLPLTWVEHFLCSCITYQQQHELSAFSLTSRAFSNFWSIVDVRGHLSRGHGLYKNCKTLTNIIHI